MSDGGAKWHVVAEWVDDEDGGKITYGEMSGGPQRARQAQRRHAINRGEWYVPLRYFTVCYDADGVFVCNDDVPEVNVCMKAILLLPNDARPPRTLLPRAKRFCSSQLARLRTTTSSLHLQCVRK